jgi:hypothetical protein
MAKLQLFNTYTFAGEHYRSVKRPRYVIFNQKQSRVKWVEHNLGPDVGSKFHRPQQWIQAFLSWPSFGNEKKLSPLPLVPLLLHPNAAQGTIWNF